jgi:hypothetical protein
LAAALSHLSAVVIVRSKSKITSRGQLVASSPLLHNARHAPLKRAIFCERSSAFNTIFPISYIHSSVYMPSPASALHSALRPLSLDPVAEAPTPVHLHHRCHMTSFSTFFGTEQVHFNTEK